MILPPSTSGNTAGRCGRRGRIQRGDIGAGRSLHHVVEDLRRAAKARRRAGLVLRDRHRPMLGVVHLVEIDELAMRIDDGNGELPVAGRFRGLGNDRLDDISGAIGGDRISVRDIERHLVRHRRRSGRLPAAGPEPGRRSSRPRKPQESPKYSDACLPPKDIDDEGIDYVAGRAVPLRYPADVDSRRFPGLLKLNLGVRIARYARFAAVAKTIADVPNAPDGTSTVARARLTTREVNR